MFGNLTADQMEELLQKEVVGRIGCYCDNKVYVVPISYAYDGKNIYAHTYEGLKIDMMRKNPHVCFEIDDFNDMGRSQSVIAWGRFEEITDKEERNTALRLLLNRSLPAISSITTHLGNTWPFSEDELDDIDGIIFRISFSERTGRFEITDALPETLNG